MINFKTHPSNKCVCFRIQCLKNNSKEDETQQLKTLESTNKEGLKLTQEREEINGKSGLMLIVQPFI